MSVFNSGRKSENPKKTHTNTGRTPLELSSGPIYICDHKITYGKQSWFIHIMLSAHRVPYIKGEKNKKRDLYFSPFGTNLKSKETAWWEFILFVNFKTNCNLKAILTLWDAGQHNWTKLNQTTAKQSKCTVSNHMPKKREERFSRETRLLGSYAINIRKPTVSHVL